MPGTFTHPTEAIGVISRHYYGTPHSMMEEIPAVDIAVVTFNCEKTLIDEDVFGKHMKDALTRDGTQTTLPQIVAFSLQELAPLHDGYLGRMAKYYTPFEAALNQAAAAILDNVPAPPTHKAAVNKTSSFKAVSSASADLKACYAQAALKAADNQEDDASTAPVEEASGVTRAVRKEEKNRPYTLVRASNVGMTALLVFARDPRQLTHVKLAGCGFGRRDMGNKGAVGLRALYTSASGHKTELTFVAAHLAAMEWNLRVRNENWKNIVQDLTFANPKALLPRVFGRFKRNPNEPDRVGVKTFPGDSQPYTSSVADPLLAGHEAYLWADYPGLTREQQDRLQNISIFKPSSHLIVAGDFNYRIHTRPPPAVTDTTALFPSDNENAANHWSQFLELDQLTREREGGRAFHGLKEAPLSFGPTYKYEVLDDATGAANEAAVRAGTDDVPWRFFRNRWPSWCDRVLYLDVPRSIKERYHFGAYVVAYRSFPVVRTSDHRAVFWRAKFPVVAPEVMREHMFAEDRDIQDPRTTIPFPIDPQSWERRKAARRREIWTAIVWKYTRIPFPSLPSRRQVELSLGALIFIGFGLYLFRNWH